MRFIHLSDTHLGFSEYFRTDPETGLNQREQDVYNAWEEAIAAILTLHPDAVLHAGDLFHSTRPNNRAIRIALEGIQKISAAGIPLLIISGNHETPRIRTTGSIFESIALFEGVHAVYENRYECHVIADMAVHCLPHCSLSEELDAALSAIQRRPGVKFQVLIAHGAWSSGNYGMGEFNELRLPDLDGLAAAPFDYIALGHYHKQLNIRNHIRYSGSTERTSLSQSGNECGFLEVDLSSQAVRFFPLHTRPMMRLPELDCRACAVQEVYEKTEALSRTCPEGSIVQLALQNVSESVLMQMDMRVLENQFSHVLHLEKSIGVEAEKDAVGRIDASLESLYVEFGRYLETVEDNFPDKKRLLELSQNYLNP
jgi:DNA repair protein SbcD/Mre11